DQRETALAPSLHGPRPHRAACARRRRTSPVSQRTSTSQPPRCPGSPASRWMRPPVAAPSGKNRTTPLPSSSPNRAAPAPVNTTSPPPGRRPLRPLAPRQLRARGSMTTSCARPLEIATARAKRSCAASSFAAARCCMPRRPPPNADIASRLAAAMIASTTSISSSVNPARPRARTVRSCAVPPRLFVADVGVHAVAAGLAVGAQAGQVERRAAARHLVLVRVVPRVVQFGLLGIGAEPAAGVAGRVHQFAQGGRQAAGVHLELLHLLRQGLHLRLGQVDLGAVAAAE